MIAANWTHRFHVVSWSTENDREIVSCLRLMMPTHFNVGLAEPDAQRGFGDIDRTPFREFEANGS